MFDRLAKVIHRLVPDEALDVHSKPHGVIFPKSWIHQLALLLNEMPYYTVQR